VKYRGTPTDVGGKWWHWLCPSSGGIVSELDFESLQMSPFNTNNGTTKPGDEPFKTYAFVWGQDGTLLAGIHKQSSVHHSSFMMAERTGGDGPRRDRRILRKAVPQDLRRGFS
jgi:hypothetical protein